MRRMSRDETDDLATRILAMLAGKLDDATMARVREMLLGAATDNMTPEEMDPGAGASDALAMDARPSSAEGQRALRLAAHDVAPVIGERAALAMDSAADAYRAGLRAVGRPDLAKQHATALPVMFRVAMDAGRTAPANGPGGANTGMLLRSAPLASGSFASAFPGAARIRAA